MRTGDIYAPWPEEGNRRLVGPLSALHFAPTQRSRLNLLREGVKPESIHVTGNTVIDALHAMTHKINTQPGLQNLLEQQFSFLSPARQMILVTGHRRENFGKGFERICQALAHIANRFPQVDILYPVHLNPSVQRPVTSLLAGMDNVFLIPPVDYLAFVYLMKSSYLILTDSGGIQEEAPSLGKPVLVMRDNTERPEALAAGCVQLVGTDVENIVSHVARLLTDDVLYQGMSHAKNPYGDGKSSARILDIISRIFESRRQDQRASKQEIGVG